jgi:biopolymer transport protein ExbD
MSHGAPGAASGADPNLTPLLDLVLQLLMFFMICANFTAAQNNEPVKLAESDSAKLPDDRDSTQPSDQGDKEFVFITVKKFNPQELGPRVDERDRQLLLDSFTEKTPCVVVIGAPTVLRLIGGVGEKDQDKQDKEEADKEKSDPELLKEARWPFTLYGWLKQRYEDSRNHSKDGQCHLSVVIRPGEDIDYAVIYQVLRYCRNIGFKNLKVRALIGKVGE